MSLGDEPAVSQHGPNSVMSSQRSGNGLPVPQPVSPTVNKPNTLNTSFTGGNRNFTKASSVPVRSRPERCLSKQESFESDTGAVPPHHRLRNNPKVKLLQRSHALREETSPPRESEMSHPSSNNPNDKSSINKAVNGVNSSNNNNNPPNSSNTSNSGRAGNSGMGHGSNPGYSSGSSLQVNNMSRSSSRHRLRHQGSSQGSMDTSSPCLSRDSSTEQYMENLGIDLNQFLIDTLNRSLKDRVFLLQIEQELVALVREAKRGTFQRFPGMTSYQRMLVHRVAAYFKMDHNVDPSGNGVIVTVTPNSRIPEVKFNELIREDFRFSEEPRRCILKRDSSSFEEGMHFRSPERHLSGDSRRSKSFEEREEEYERARKRIFNRDDGYPIGPPYRSHDPNSRRSSHEDLRWHGDPQFWSSSDSDICSSRGRHFPPSKYERYNRFSKMESFEGNDTLKANSLKSSVSKSYSFGGYPGMSRGDSISSCSSRPFMKQADSVTSSVSSTRLSPSSSGYKSQSMRSDVTVSTTPSPNQATSQRSFSPEPNTVVWAVSSLTSVPPGALLINPASGQPYTNPDGSLYRYDPENPIKLCPTIEEDVSANTVYKPTLSKIVTGNTPDYVIKEKDKKVETSVQTTKLESSGNEVTANKSTTVLINSSTSPSLPELPRSVIPATDTKPQQSDSGRADAVKQPDYTASYTAEAMQNNPNSGQMNSSVLETMTIDVTQTSYNGIDGGNSVYMDNMGSDGLLTATNCQGDGTDYSGQMSYQMGYSSTSDIQNAPEYGSQSADNGGYMNSNVEVTSLNYAMEPPYSAETMQMPPEMLYSQSVLYTAEQQSNPYGVVQTPTVTAAATPGVQAPPPPPPPPLPPAVTAVSGAGVTASNISVPTTASTYESRPNEANPSMAVPELSNYFMNLNIGNEQIPTSGTPAPQLGYSWGPSPNTSQTQGSSHSSQVQMYYLPGSVTTGTIHQKYTSTTPSMYTYNVPPVVYQTDLCQSVIQNTATTVFPASYYSPGPTTTMSYRTPTPPTPSAVTTATVGPTSFFVYHPQSSAPTQPTPLQFGMVRPQQAVPGIRSSPPPGPRPRVPYHRSMSDRGRYSSMDSKTSNFHFSSPLSMYGLRFMPGDFQSIGMMRPMSNFRGSSGGFNSNSSYYGSSQGSGNDPGLISSRPPRPRKPR